MSRSPGRRRRARRANALFNLRYWLWQEARASTQSADPRWQSTCSVMAGRALGHYFLQAEKHPRIRPRGRVKLELELFDRMGLR